MHFAENLLGYILVKRYPDNLFCFQISICSDMPQFLTVNRFTSVGKSSGPTQGEFIIIIKAGEDNFFGRSVIVHNRDMTFVGIISERDNSNVATIGRNIVIDGSPLPTYVNLVDLLTKLIQKNGTMDEGKPCKFFYAKVRRCDSKLQIDVERTVNQF